MFQRFETDDEIAAEIFTYLFVACTRIDSEFSFFLFFRYLRSFRLNDGFRTVTPFGIFSAESFQLGTSPRSTWLGSRLQKSSGTLINADGLSVLVTVRVLKYSLNVRNEQSRFIIPFPPAFMKSDGITMFVVMRGEWEEISENTNSRVTTLRYRHCHRLIRSDVSFWHLCESWRGAASFDYWIFSGSFDNVTRTS